MRQFLLAFGAILTLLGCPGDRVRSPNPIPVPDTELCGAMCDHLASLGCPESKPVYDSDEPGPRRIPNLTCTRFCEKQQANGIFINPRCVLKIKACDDLESARQKQNCGD